mmetsp:Transcript_40596/g.100308  ORF Transcript_40596/g.100308 Transcript_40596/m.100308 type:complete len:284 (-) Transcript_40596:456-1307(-)
MSRTMSAWNSSSSTSSTFRPTSRSNVGSGDGILPGSARSALEVSASARSLSLGTPGIMLSTASEPARLVKHTRPWPSRVWQTCMPAMQSSCADGLGTKAEIGRPTSSGCPLKHCSALALIALISPSQSITTSGCADPSMRKLSENISAGGPAETSTDLAGSAAMSISDSISPAPPAESVAGPLAAATGIAAGATAGAADTSPTAAGAARVPSSLEAAMDSAGATSTAPRVVSAVSGYISDSSSPVRPPTKSPPSKNPPQVWRVRGGEAPRFIPNKPIGTALDT